MAWPRARWWTTSLWVQNTGHPCNQDCCCSVTKLCLNLCDPMDHRTPGFSVLHYLLEFAQTHVHRVGDIIQPSRPLSSPSPPVFNFSQHRCSVTQSCSTLCNPVDCSKLGSSVHGILQARILELVTMPFSRGSSQPRDWTDVSYVSCIGRRVLYH